MTPQDLQAAAEPEKQKWLSKYKSRQGRGTARLSWENGFNACFAQLKVAQEENEELKKELHFRKAQIAVGEDTEASLQARNKALAEENEGLEKLLLRNFNDNCTKEDMEAFMKIYARYHPEALAQEKEPRS